MVRHARERSRQWVTKTATANGVWSVPVNRSYSAVSSESCSDSIGAPVVPSAFVVGKLDRSKVGGLNGRAQVITGVLDVECQNWLPGYQRFGSITHVDTGAPNPAGLGATLLSRTNPSRPTIVPFTLVQDLYDVPRMLKSVGRLIKTPKSLLSPKEVANQYLGAKFGWLPLIDDTKKLLNVGQYIDARVNELRRLYSEQGLKRRLQLGSNSAVSTEFGFSWDDDFTGLVSTNIHRGTTVKTWGTVRWKPNNLPCPGWTPSDAEILRKATQIVSGFTTEGVVKGAWDLLPWTWMVDWFSNVGDWLTQSSSTVPASPSEICIMQEFTTVGQHTLLSQLRPGLKDSGGLVINTRKTRVVGSGTLAASLPTLDANRLSILGALFVQRFKR